MKKKLLSFTQMRAIAALYPKLKKKAAINGDFLIVSMDTGTGPEEVAFSTNCKLSLDMAGAKATTKDSNGWEEIIAGNSKWTMETDGLVDFHPSTGYHGVADLSAAWIARQKVTLYFTPRTGAISGDQQWWGVAFITKIEVSAKQGDTVTYTASFTGTGALTEVTV